MMMKNHSSTKRVAMISGANRGIGLAIARQLARQGYALSLGVRQPEAFDAVKAFGTSEDIHIFAYEATEKLAGQRWLEACLQRFGRLDVLVNSAGLLRKVSLADGLESDLDAMIEVNVKGPFRLIQATLPALRQSGRGRVVNIASLSGKRVRNDNVGYQMSKFALVALSHAVRAAAWDDGVRALALCPGFVKTDMALAASSMPPEDMTSPEDLARLVGLIVELPNTASISELLVNCSYEVML
jgi:NAD(P)-dependent dehydrogenase (short-subunit alcohol dehydrogenase family)